MLLPVEQNLMLLRATKKYARHEKTELNKASISSLFFLLNFWVLCNVGEFFFKLSPWLVFCQELVTNMSFKLV